MTRYLTRSASKSLDRSLKSELTNIETLDFGLVNDQVPGGVEAHLRRLRLPEVQIEGPIRFVQLRTTFNDVRPHGENDSKGSRRERESMARAVIGRVKSVNQ